MERQKNSWDILIGIVVFGSLWGTLEATVGGLLHLVHFPYAGAIMANIGFTLMATAVAIYRRPSLPLGIGLVAASFKLLDILLLSLSPFAQAVVNPAVAIVLEALAFQVAVTLLWKPYLKGSLARSGAGLLGMYLAYFAIALVFFYALGRGPREVLTPGELLSFALRDGALAAGITLLSVPLGHRLGQWLSQAKERAILARPKLYYLGATGLIALCWLAAALSLR
ncbi:MAG: hypothetical protein NUW06_04050 [Candidatus Acetothermia bacterium]|jgi:hypothetical protein|nr:hypothetical protein [Candidatus Acetothermia bacterium]MDH7505122.1 hypothetical protein [Candidatus Acetothermia bacterium]